MIIWLASYPKSGNTWVRAFLSSYFYSTDGSFNFSLLDKINEFPDHKILNRFMDSKDFHKLAEVSKHWIKVQEFINLKNKFVFLKTHSAFCHINGNNFTDNKNTLLAVYVVRDPRNVTLSLSNHFGISQEESLDILTNEKYIIYPEINKQLIPSTLVGSWKNNYLSWKDCENVNRIIIKYEDLVENSTKTFKKIIDFIGKKTKHVYDEKKFLNAVKTTQFETLKKLEDKHGFNMGQKDKFFHLGKKNNWRNLLDKKIENKIKNLFKLEMKDLDYN